MHRHVECASHACVREHPSALLRASGCRTPHPSSDSFLYQFDLDIPHCVTLSEAKGLSSSQPRYFAEPVLSGAEDLSMTCEVFTSNWY
jgi:hypothetical protein